MALYGSITLASLLIIKILITASSYLTFSVVAAEGNVLLLEATRFFSSNLQQHILLFTIPQM